MAAGKHARKRSLAPRRPGPGAARAGRSTATLDRVSHYLRELYHNLSLVRCALLISVRMLEAQNADADADVASLLRYDIGQRLDAEIERTKDLIARIGGPAGHTVHSRPGTRAPGRRRHPRREGLSPSKETSAR